mmetsp:Transcript_48459/g.96394  ORF Transcript_48459/g.96394 Transcript_48459/m.96394 type:complete len:423 (+) Transcript_48459:68-1336(+)
MTAEALPFYSAREDIREQPAMQDPHPPSGPGFGNSLSSRRSSGLSLEVMEKGARPLPSRLPSRESQATEGLCQGQHLEAGSGMRNEQHLLLVAIDGLRKAAEAALDRAQAAEADALKHREAAEAVERSKAAELQRLREAGRLVAALFEDGQREKEQQCGVVQGSLEARIANSVVAEVRAAVRAVSEEAAVELRAAAEELRRLRTGVVSHSEDSAVPVLARRSVLGSALTAAGATIRRRRYSCEGRSLGHCSSSPTLSSCSGNTGSGTYNAIQQQELLPRAIAEIDDALSSSPRGSSGRGGHDSERPGQFSREAVVPHPCELRDGLSVSDTRDSQTTSPNEGREEVLLPHVRSPVLRLRKCSENRVKRGHSVTGGETELSRSASGESATFATPATPGQVRARARLQGSDAWWLAGHSSDVQGG